MKVVVVIPIYKEEPTVSELASFRQCFNILRKYPIRLVTYKGINLVRYQEFVDSQLETILFEKNFFESIVGYNRLMKSHDFYRKFRRYDYMLIYQLDAWVFNDSLLDWCERGFDYIGAPWFENFSTQVDGNKLWKVGNGGLSLRSIRKFLKVTNPYLHFETIQEIFSHDYSGIRSLPFCLAKIFGYKNTIKYYSNKNFAVNEDYYFSILFEPYSNLKLYVPDLLEAARFSIECGPRYLSNIIQSLPFGCHAYEKYEWDFWRNFINQC